MCGFSGQDLLSFSPAKTEIRISYSKYIKHRESMSDRVVGKEKDYFSTTQRGSEDFLIY